MNGTVITATITPPGIVSAEILRYSGAAGSAPRLMTLIDECINETSDKLSYKVCYTEFQVACKGNMIDLGFAKVSSNSLAKNLAGCESIVLFAATLGIGIDRLIAKYCEVSPTKALVLQALGAERIEALCDEFCRKLTCEYGDIRPRFSPGYGDFPLEVQRKIFSVLDCQRRIGLTLNESLLMTPTKSVTAVVGIKNHRRSN